MKSEMTENELNLSKAEVRHNTVQVHHIIAESYHS